MVARSRMPVVIVISTQWAEELHHAQRLLDHRELDPRKMMNKIDAKTDVSDEMIVADAKNNPSEWINASGPANRVFVNTRTNWQRNDSLSHR